MTIKIPLPKKYGHFLFQVKVNEKPTNLNKEAFILFEASLTDKCMKARIIYIHSKFSKSGAKIEFIIFNL